MDDIRLLICFLFNIFFVPIIFLKHSLHLLSCILFAFYSVRNYLFLVAFRCRARKKDRQLKRFLLFSVRLFSIPFRVEFSPTLFSSFFKSLVCVCVCVYSTKAFTSYYLLHFFLHPLLFLFSFVLFLRTLLFCFYLKAFLLFCKVLFYFFFITLVF